MYNIFLFFINNVHLYILVLLTYNKDYFKSFDMIWDVHGDSEKLIVHFHHTGDKLKQWHSCWNLNFVSFDRQLSGRPGFNLRWGLTKDSKNGTWFRLA